MNCPDCNSKTKITDTRAHEQGTWRRHKCVCSGVFTTLETLCDTVPTKKGRPFGAKAIALARRVLASTPKKAPIGVVTTAAHAPVAHPKTLPVEPTRLRLERLREERELAAIDEDYL